MHRRLVVLTVVAIVAGVVLVGVLARGGTVQPHPWELRGDPAPSDTTVPLTVLGGGCGADTEQVVRVEIEETPQQVTIATYIRKDRWHNGPCTAIGTAHPVTAHLDRRSGAANWSTPRAPTDELTSTATPTSNSRPRRVGQSSTLSLATRAADCPTQQRRRIQRAGGVIRPKLDASCRFVLIR